MSVAEFAVNTTTASSQETGSSQAVASDASGNNVVVWQSYNQDSLLTWGVYAQRLAANGTRIGNETLINTVSLLNDQQRPSVAMNATGQYAVAWDGGGLLGLFPGIYVQRMNADGTPNGSEIGVAGSIALSVNRASIGMAADGSFVVVYEAVDALLSRGVFARRYDASGSPLGASFRVNPATSGLQQAPQVAVRADGSFVVVWEGDGTGDASGVFARAYNADGSTATGEVLVNQTVAGVQEAASVRVLESSAGGGFAVAWAGNSASDGDGVYLRRFDASGAALAGEQLVNQTTTGVQTAPSLAVDPDGDLVVAWSGAGTGDSNGVLWREYSASGSPRSGEALLSTTTTGTQQRPSVVGTGGDNGYVAAWCGNAAADADGVLAALLHNQAPIGSATGGTASYTENAAGAVVDAGLTVTDADSPALTSATIRISANFAAGQDILGFVDQLGITGSYNAGTGVLTLSGTNSVTNYQAALRSITYANSSENPTIANRTIEFVVSDGTDSSGAVSRSVNVTAVNDAPVVGASGGTVGYTENESDVTVDGGLGVGDVDSATLTGATVRISANFAAGQDILGFADQFGITGSYNSGTGVLTLSGTTSVANYQTALRSVTYANSSENPSTANRTIEFVVTDGSDNSIAVSRVVSVATVNDAPVVGMSVGSAGYTENGTGTVIDSLLTISDVDSTTLAGATVRISSNFITGQDELVFVNQLGISGVFNAGTGVLTLSGTASVANYQTALRSITYLNSSDNPATTNRTLEVVVNDGADSSTPATRSLAITAVNDAPIATTSGGSAAFTENDIGVVIDAGLSVIDADSAVLTSATVWISANFATGQDLLAFTDQLGITGSFNAGTGVLTLSGAATLASYQTALRAVAFVNTSDNPATAARVIEFVVSDGVDSSVAVTRTVTVAAVNDVPVATMSGGAAAYTEDGAGVPVDGGVIIADVDSITLAGASLQITGNFVAAEDALVFTDQLGISGLYSPLTGILTLSGTASLASYQMALRSVTYLNASDNPDSTTRLIELILSDGIDVSIPATRSMVINAINDRPVVMTSGGAAAYVENMAAVVIDGGVTIADLDDAILTGATIRISANFVAGQDVLAFSDQSGIVGSYDGATGILTLTGSASLAAYTAALRTVRYANSSENPTATTRVIELIVSDGGSDSLPATRSLTVAAVNDAPIAGVAIGPVAYIENSMPVVLDAGLTISDPDSTTLVGAVVRIAAGFVQGEDILGFVSQFGIVGSYTSSTGVLALSGSASLSSYQAVLRTVTYFNSSDAPSSVARVLEMTVDDGAAGSAATMTLLSVTAVNDVPIVTVSGGATTFTENAPGTVIDAGVDIEDPDSGSISSATVSVAAGFNSGQDVLVFVSQFGIAGSYNPLSGVLTLSGAATLGQYRAALQSIAYANTSEAPSTTPRTIQITVNDGIDISLPVTRAILVVAVNDVPYLSPPSGNASYVEDASGTTIDPSLTLSDVDSAMMTGAVVRIAVGLDVGRDQLVLTAPSGMTVSYDAATGTLTISGAASLAAYQAALRAVTFHTVGDQPSTLSRTIEFRVNDGGGASSPVTRNVSVTAVNDAPTVSASAGAVTFIENAAPLRIDSSIELNDPDSSTLTGALVRIVAGYVSGEDLLEATMVAGIAAVWHPHTGILELSGIAPVNAYTAVLRSLTYRNNSETPSPASRIVSVVLSDGSLVGNPAARTLFVVPVNDAPGINVNGAAINYIENAAPLVLDAAAALADPDSSMLIGASVQIITGYAMGQDTLSLTTIPGISVAWDVITGMLTLSGVASVAAYQAALQTIRYSNSSDDPSAVGRQISIRVDDGVDASTQATLYLLVIPENDRPVLSMVSLPLPYAENGPALSIDEALSLSDVDSTTLVSARVQIAGGYVSGEDRLLLVNPSGLSGQWDTVSGTLTISGIATLSGYLTALRRVAYVNSSDDPTSVSRVVRVTVNDGAAASVSADRVIAVVPVNDVPIVSGLGPGYTYLENSGPLNVAVGVSLTDADTPELSGAAIIFASGFTSGEDVLAAMVPTGIAAAWDEVHGVLTLSGVAPIAEYLAAIRSLTYTNSSDHPSLLGRSISLIVDDGTGVSMAVTTYLDVSPINDVPQLTVRAMAAPLTWSAAPTSLSLVVDVTDADSGQLQGATIRLVSSASLGGVQLTLAGDHPLITAEWDAAALELRLVGTASLSEYQLALSDLLIVGGIGNTQASQLLIHVSVVDDQGGAQSAQAALSVLAPPVVQPPPPPPTPTDPPPIDIPGGGAGQGAGGVPAGSIEVDAPSPVIGRPPQIPGDTDDAGRDEMESIPVAPTVGQGTLAPRIVPEPAASPPAADDSDPDPQDPSEAPIPSLPPTDPGPLTEAPSPPSPGHNPAVPELPARPVDQPLMDAPERSRNSPLTTGASQTRQSGARVASMVELVERAQARASELAGASLPRRVGAALGISSTTVLLGLSAMAVSSGAVLLWIAGGAITARLAFASVLRLRGFDLLGVLRWWECRERSEAIRERLNATRRRWT